MIFLPSAYLLLCGGSVGFSSLYFSSWTLSKRSDGKTVLITSLKTGVRHLPFLPSIHTRSTSDTFHMSSHQCRVSRSTGIPSLIALRGLISSLGSYREPQLSHSSL